MGEKESLSEANRPSTQHQGDSVFDGGCVTGPPLTLAAAAQVTLLMDAAGTKELEELPAYKELLQFFITPEVRYPAANYAQKSHGFHLCSGHACLLHARSNQQECL